MLPKYIELILLCIFAGSSINIVSGLHAEAIEPTDLSINQDLLNGYNALMLKVENGKSIGPGRKFLVKLKSPSRHGTCEAALNLNNAIVARHGCVQNLMFSAPNLSYDDFEVQRDSDGDIIQITDIKKLLNQYGEPVFDLLRLYLAKEVGTSSSDTEFIRNLEKFNLGQFEIDPAMFNL